ncbi:MAG TPA: ABC transporter substrate-binding protein [Actinomycetota bacterium]
MRMRWRALQTLVAVTLAAGTAPSGAVPIGPPTISFDAIRTGGSTYRLIATAEDPDGQIVEMSLCAGTSCEAWSEVSPGPGELLACVTGDQEVIEIIHTFPGPGIYEVTTRATGEGCPLLGAREHVEEVFTVEVPDLPDPGDPPPHQPIACADPGTPTSTAPGVDSERVTIAMTIELSDPHAREVSQGAMAAVEVINALGGVCDRILQVLVADDGGDTQERRGYVRFFEERAFALVGQEVQGVITDIEEAGMPAVGSYATSRDEFPTTWIWPIRAGNDSFGRIAVEHTYGQAARRFGVVYDTTTPIGTETRDAVEAAIAEHDDAVLVASIGVQPFRPSYSAEIQALNTACDGACDTVLYAIEEETLITWMAGRPQRARIDDILHPTLFGERVAGNCGSPCHGMLAFDDVHPPIGSHPGEVARYCDDLRSVDPTADCWNPATQAAYAATFVAARAMGTVGVNLTRDRLREVLATGSYDLAMHGEVLSWDHPRRHANRWLRGYSIVMAQGSFVGWRTETGWIEDPRG